MKLNLFAALLAVWCTSVCAQTLKLNMSTPQPRLGQSFTISVSADTLADILFRPIAGNFKISPGKDASNQASSFVITADAKTIGKQHNGPLKLEFNGIKFTTDKIEFEIIDSLPAVDKGLWIRKVIVNDTEFSILTDQRIPTTPYTSKTDSSITTEYKARDGSSGTTLVANDEGENIRSNGSTTSSSPQTVRSQGKELEVNYYFGVYNFIIVNKKKPVVLRKSDFKDLPPDFKFQDIVVN